jgi:hypothetical protein
MTPDAKRVRGYPVNREPGARVKAFVPGEVGEELFDAEPVVEIASSVWPLSWAVRCCQPLSGRMCGGD